MKKIGKKLLSLFVAAVMILTTLSVTAVSIGASCALPLPDYPAGAGYGNGCWNFANLVYNRYWGYSFTNSQNTTDNILYSNGVPINAASRQATASNLKKYIYDYKVPIGSVLRISTTLNYVSAANDGDLGHSMIITGYTSSNVTIYHVAGGKVLLQTLTYDYIATWMNINNGTQSIGNAYIKYIKAGTPAVPSEPVSIITLKNIVVPTNVQQGKPLPIGSGSVLSPNSLSYAWCAVYTDTNRQHYVTGADKYNIGSGSFSYSAFENSTRFASLAAGTYYLSYGAVDVKGYTVEYQMPFTVSSAPTSSKTVTYKGAHDHSNYWNSGVVTKSPTCTDAGVKTYTCTECKATRTESIAAKGHTAVTVTGTPATCTSTGLTEGSKCSVCNAVLTEQETIAALGHSYGGWSVTKQAGCTSDGEEVRTCSVCGHTERSAIKATGHNYSVTVVKPTATSEGYTMHKCLKCGDNYKTDTVPPIPDTNAAKAVLETKNAVPGYTVTVDIVLENVPALKSLAVKDITYDSSKLELVGGAWKNVNGAVISDWNSADKNAVLAFSSNTDLNKAIFTLTFKVADDADDAAASVGCTLSARQKPENGTETEVEIAVIPGSIIISKTLRGDVNGDGYLDSDDAIYMLSHVLMPEMYSINQNGDFNKDGSIDSDDAIYLLYYVLMPDLYPLK